MGRLSGKVAVVTGALGLLGRQHCKALSEAGATVVVGDLSEGECESFANALQNETDSEAMGIHLDVTQPDSIVAARVRILEKFSRLDVLINNAGVNEMVEQHDSNLPWCFENYPLALWDRSLAVNLTGVFLCSQVLGSFMASQQSGSIVNIASTYGIVAPDQSLYRKQDGAQSFFKSPAYSTTKGGIISFTRYLATYWGTKGVRVNCLTPGGVQNGQGSDFINAYSARTPIGKMARPWDYRAAIVFLASDASSYMTGSNLIVDGGWTAW